jgi:hypothetical protein
VHALLLLLVGMHLQLLPSLLVLLLIRARNRTSSLRASRLLSPCVAPTLIYESHQQMCQRLFTLEECQCEMHTSMGFETPELVVYLPLPPPAVEDPCS